MSCVSLVDLGLELTTLFEFQFFPIGPPNGLQCDIRSLYAPNKKDKNTRDGVE